MNTAKPGYKSTEFLIAIILIVGAVASAKYGAITPEQCLEFIKWLFGFYAGARAASKFGANETGAALLRNILGQEVLVAPDWKVVATAPPVDPPPASPNG